MPLATPSEPDPDDPEVEFVEVDPTGRYGRYKEVLGKGAFKKVYRAFDELEGIEVAWNQVKVSELWHNASDLDRLYSEVHLLKTLKHKNIIKFYNSWVDTRNENINIITEIFTSGTLRQYRKKHKHVDLRALKKWSRQILEGLVYLHGHNPPIIHRDLKCDNIFVNGNHGEVKIGDLGLAAILHHAKAAHSVIGTPQFMAPELYEEEYNELVDIYAFGMCLLELVTLEYPYVECSNDAQVYKKVTAGIKPASLVKVTDPDVKAFIEKCIANVSQRMSAEELLRDPFLSNTNQEIITRSLHINVSHSGVTVNQSSVATKALEDTGSGQNRDVTVQGEMKDANTIFIKLRIADSTGEYRNIHFPFDIEADTSIAVASEMVHELDLTEQDVPTIAEMIDAEIQSLIPSWSPLESFEDESVDSHVSENKDDLSPFSVNDNKDETSPSKIPTGNFSLERLPSVNKDDLSPFSVNDYRDETSPSKIPPGNFRLERLPSGRMFWSDSPRAGAVGSPSNPSFLSPSDVASGIAKYKYFLGKVGNGDSHERKSNEVANEHDNSDKTLERAVSVKNCTGFQKECDSEKKDVLMNQSEENARTFGNNESEVVRKTAEKLDLLLADQLKELDELKRKHELAMSDLLKGLPPGIQTKMFSSFSRNIIPDYKMHSEMNLYSGNLAKPESYISSAVILNRIYSSSSLPVKKVFTRSSSSIDVRVNPNFFDFLKKVSRPLVGATVPPTRFPERLKSLNRRSSFKCPSESDVGIAVILKDD